jgi:hypothetical protein
MAPDMRHHCILEYKNIFYACILHFKFNSKNYKSKIYLFSILITLSKVPKYVAYASPLMTIAWVLSLYAHALVIRGKIDPIPFPFNNATLEAAQMAAAQEVVSHFWQTCNDHPSEPFTLCPGLHEFWAHFRIAAAFWWALDLKKVM